MPISFYRTGLYGLAESVPVPTRPCLPVLLSEHLLASNLHLTQIYSQTPSCPFSDEHLRLTNVRLEMLLHLCICSDYLRKKHGFPWSEWFVWGKHINQCLMPELLQYKTSKPFLYVLLWNHTFPSSAYIGFFFLSFLLNAELHIYSLSFQCEWFRSLRICILLSK